MADLSSIAAVKANLVQVTIGADTGPYEASVGFVVKDVRHPVKSARAGQDVLAVLVTGRNVELEMEFIQYDGALLKLLTHATADNPALGSQSTPTSVRIHDPQELDATSDLLLPAVVFLEASRTMDGDKERRIKVKAQAIRDSATGKVYRIGV